LPLTGPLPRIKEASAIRSRGSSLHGGNSARSVIGAEDHDRVLGNFRPSDRVQNLAHPLVHPSKDVGILAEPPGIGLVKVRMHGLRRVEVRKPNVGEERLLTSGVRPDVVHSSLGDHLIEVWAHRQVQLISCLRRAPLLRLPELWRINVSGLGERPVRCVRGVASLVNGVPVAPPLIEAKAGGKSVICLTAMPLTPRRRRVPGIREELRNRVLSR
jgi:hypothetical protein